MGLKSLLGVAKSGVKAALPIAGGVVGGVVGGPAGAAAGISAGKSAGKLIGGGAKPRTGGSSVASSVKELPQSASSLPMARSQDKARMKRSYGYPSGGGE